MERFLCKTDLLKMGALFMLNLTVSTWYLFQTTFIALTFKVVVKVHAPSLTSSVPGTHFDSSAFRAFPWALFALVPVHVKFQGCS